MLFTIVSFFFPDHGKRCLEHWCSSSPYRHVSGYYRTKTQITYSLCWVIVSSSKVLYCICIIPESMKLVCLEIQLLCFWSRSWGNATPLLRSKCSSATTMRCMFLREFCCVVIATSYPLEFPYWLAKRGSSCIEVIECIFSVKTEFCKCMPSCKVKEHVENNISVRCRQEALKDWDCTLYSCINPAEPNLSL